MSWPGIAYRVMWYVDLSANAMATRMPNLQCTMHKDKRGKERIDVLKSYNN
jgi:hypothetical protein